jgi:phosphoribosylanthranilate isomerase
MPRTRVKICGLTRAQDVDSACALGADAVGFVCFEDSPRFVPLARLANLARLLPPFVTPVLLFVNAAADDVRRALDAVPDALLQFHGAETAVDCARYGRPFVRALAMAEGVDLLDFESAFADASALLADAPTRDFGGAGAVFDWRRVPAPGERTKPLILAGGLNAGNVRGAIEAVQPFAVDVSSGVEEARAIKSAAKMREFIAAVHAADARHGTL